MNAINVMSDENVSAQNIKSVRTMTFHKKSIFLGMRMKSRPICEIISKYTQIQYFDEYLNK